MSEDLESYWTEIRVPPRPKVGVVVPDSPPPATLTQLSQFIRDRIYTLGDSIPEAAFWLGLMYDSEREVTSIPRQVVTPQQVHPVRTREFLFEAEFTTAGRDITVEYFALWAHEEGGEPLIVRANDNGPCVLGVGTSLTLRYILRV